MRRYDKYKTSSIFLVRELPAHWQLTRNKSVMAISGKKVGNKADQYPLLSLTTKGIIRRDIESGKGKFPKEFDTYQIVKKDELVFCLFDIDETPRTVGIVNFEGMITGAYTALSVNTKYSSPKFLYYYYVSVDDAKALKPYYSGLRKTIRPDKFLQLYMPMPPLVEQEKIVQFIESKTLCIDAYVRERVTAA